MDAASRATTCLQIFDGVLRPLVLDQQVQAMTGQKRVLRIGVADIRAPLQAKLQCITALLPEGIGKGLAKHAAKRRQGFGWERWSKPWLYDTLKLFNGYRVRRDEPKVAPAG